MRTCREAGSHQASGRKVRHPATGDGTWGSWCYQCKLIWLDDGSVWLVDDSAWPDVCHPVPTALADIARITP